MPKILDVRSVHDYNDYVGQPDTHPLISVIDYTSSPPIRHCRCQFSVYGLFLRDDTLEDLTYGCSKYDYHEGTLICVAPGQIGGVEDNGEVFRIEGWALLFHPELLFGSALASRMKAFSFFSYQVNEALHMTHEERETIISLMRQIRDELKNPADSHQREILVHYIGLILNFCLRFYERQFNTRKVENNNVLARFEHILHNYFESEKQLSDGLPTVQWCAEQLFMSPKYFSDLVKRTTGSTPSEQIRRHVINMAKNMLIEGKSINNIAYDLGFDYPQHLSRMFKKYVGRSPSEYIQAERK